MKKICGLSHGDSGKGKTHFIGTMCKFGRPFIIDTERGLLSIADKDGQYDHSTVSTYREFVAAVDWYFANAVEKKYTYLVVDSITRLQRLLIDEILKVPMGDTLSALALKPKTLSIREWGEINTTMTAVVDTICLKSPTSVHFTALSGESTDEVSGITKVWPLVQGGFRFQLPGFFDLVLYHDSQLKDGKVNYYIQTEGCARNIAKNRMGHLGKLKTFELNNYEVIHNVLKEL